MVRNTFTLMRKRRVSLGRGFAVVLLLQTGFCPAFAQKASVSEASARADAVSSKVSAPVKISETLKQSRLSALRESLQTQGTGDASRPAVSIHHMSADQRARLREELRQQHHALQMEREARTKRVCVQPKECQEEP